MLPQSDSCEWCASTRYIANILVTIIIIIIFIFILCKYLHEIVSFWLLFRHHYYYHYQLHIYYCDRCGLIKVEERVRQHRIRCRWIPVGYDVSHSLPTILIYVLLPSQYTSSTAEKIQISQPFFIWNRSLIPKMGLILLNHMAHFEPYGEVKIWKMPICNELPVVRCKLLIEINMHLLTFHSKISLDHMR